MKPTLLLLLALSVSSYGQKPTSKPQSTAMEQQATFGSGCFWCTEAVFLAVKGVSKVESGYSGGSVKNPTYKEVCTGLTGHAEVTRITFDASVVSYSDLLEIFWNTHDPTTLNRQGNDEGPQYRSVIFYHDDNQKKVAEAYKAQLESSKVFASRIVTEISPLTNYYPAEDYHQNYYALNPNAGYCQYVIRPKVEKFRKQFKNKLK
jgi:peptide-methionine (S)-S-oxide reductase